MRFLWFFFLKSCFGFEPVWPFSGGGSVFFGLFLTPQHANLARWALIANPWSVLAANGSFFRSRLKKVKWPFLKVEKVRKWKKKKQSSVPLVMSLMHALWQRRRCSPCSPAGFTEKPQRSFELGNIHSHTNHLLSQKKLINWLDWCLCLGHVNSLDQTWENYICSP